MSIISDDKLPQLNTVLAPEVVVDKLSEHLKHECTDFNARLTKCEIEKTYYKPGIHCGILYRLTLKTESGDHYNEWLFGRVCRAEKVNRSYQRALKNAVTSEPSHELFKGLPPVSLWPEMNMVLWLFPEDPKIKQLTSLADPAFVRNRINENIQFFYPGSNNRHAEDIHLDRIKYMPGKRCVLRYTVKCRNGTDDTLKFYSKTYNDSTSRYHYAFLERVYEQFSDHDFLVIPRPIMHLEDANTFWQEEWQSKAISDVVGEVEHDVLFPKVALMLAKFHQSKIDNLRSAPDLSDIFDAAADDGLRLKHKLPDYTNFVETSVAKLSSGRPTLAQQAVPARVPIHDAFRLEQLLISGDQIGMVDLDAVAFGDPLSDVAEFLASLMFREFDYGEQHDKLTYAAGLFLNAYQENVPWQCDKKRIEWYIIAFGISKVFLAMKNLRLTSLKRLAGKREELLNRLTDFLE